MGHVEQGAGVTVTQGCCRHFSLFALPPVAGGRHGVASWSQVAARALLLHPHMTSCQKEGVESRTSLWPLSFDLLSLLLIGWKWVTRLLGAGLGNVTGRSPRAGAWPHTLSS
jgi:hypothetical protein